MKKHKKKAVLFLLVFGLIATQAQETTVAAGKEALGSGGTASFSIGQLVNAGYIATTGSVAQGVQQTYILVLPTKFDLGETKINLEVQAFPNPTTDWLTLTIDDKENLNWGFQLFDNNGRLIATKQITTAQETINISSLSVATYFLMVTKQDKKLKVFKIIKQ